MHRGPRKSGGSSAVSQAKKARLNLELDSPTKERLDRLQTITEADSMTQVIRKALRIYEAVFNHNQRGGKVVFRAEDGTEETIVLLS